LIHIIKSRCCSNGTYIREHAHRRERAIARILQAAGAREKSSATDGGETSRGAGATTTIARQMLRRGVRGQRYTNDAGCWEELREYPRVH